jgi:hypothetical protein
MSDLRHPSPAVEPLAPFEAALLATFIDVQPRDFVNHVRHLAEADGPTATAVARVLRERLGRMADPDREEE